MWYLVPCFSWSVCAACADGSCAGSSCCLAQCCRGGGFFPNSAVFALVLGLSVLFKEFFALALVFLGCACGVAFSLRMPLLHLGHGLVGFRCGPPHWLSLRVCVDPFWGGGAVSSFSPPARRGVGYWSLLLEFASVPLPAAPAVFPLRVLPQVTLRGLRKLFWLQLPVLLLRWSYVCWVCGVFGAALGFPPCAVLFLRGLRFCAASPSAGCPSGFLPFLTPSA